uniref:Uncharacterized protein n=1 Tax=Emiliania huxleyi TaxID=2903 RepID=A0A7S3W8R0_EMIHU
MSPAAAEQAPSGGAAVSDAVVTAAERGEEAALDVVTLSGMVVVGEPVKAEPSFTASREFQRAEAMAHVQQARVHAYERAIRDSGDGSVPGGLGGGAAETHSARQWLSGKVANAVRHDAEQFGMSGGESSTALTGERVGRARELGC